MAVRLRVGLMATSRLYQALEPGRWQNIYERIWDQEAGKPKDEALVRLVLWDIEEEHPVFDLEYEEPILVKGSFSDCLVIDMARLLRGFPEKLKVVSGRVYDKE